MEDTIRPHTTADRLPYARPELITIRSADAEAKPIVSASEGTTTPTLTTIGPS